MINMIKTLLKNLLYITYYMHYYIKVYIVLASKKPFSIILKPSSIWSWFMCLFAVKRKTNFFIVSNIAR